MRWSSRSVACLLGALMFGGASLQAAAPAGSKAYTANANADTVSVVDLNTMQVIGEPIPVGSEPRGCAVSPDGQRVYVANRFDDTVSVISTVSDTVVATVTLTAGEPYNLALSPDGGELYVVGKSSDTVSIVSTATDTEIDSIDLPAEGSASPEGLCVTPDGAKIYVVNRGDGAVAVIDTATDTVLVDGIFFGSGPRDAAVSADGSRVIVVGEDVPLIIDTSTDQPVATALTYIGNQRDVAVFGDRAYVTNFFNPSVPNVVLGNGSVGSGSLDIYDLETAQYVESIAITGDKPYGVTLSPDGTVAYVACQDSDDVHEVDLTASMETGRNAMVGSEPRAIGGLFNATPPARPYFLPKIVRAVLRGPGKDSLKAAGVFDDAGADVDYGDPVTIEVGGFSRSFTLTPNADGSVLKFKGDDLKLTLSPNRFGSSRGLFVLNISKTTLAGLVDPDAPLELHFSGTGLDDAAGVVVLTKGGFRIGKSKGTLQEPLFFPTRLVATVDETKPDKLKFKAGFSTDRPVPATLGTVVVAIGDTLRIELPGSAFKRKGDTFTHRTSEKGGAKFSVKVDFRRELLQVVSKGLELGDLPGPTTLVEFDAGDGRGSIFATVRLGTEGNRRGY